MSYDVVMCVVVIGVVYVACGVCMCIYWAASVCAVLRGVLWILCIECYALLDGLCVAYVG